MLATAFSTSVMTEPRSRPVTAAATSTLREAFSRSMTFGTALISIFATSPSLMRSPDGVSRGRALMDATLARVAGVDQTTVS
jgi:hypothetical protein